MIWGYHYFWKHPYINRKYLPFSSKSSFTKIWSNGLKNCSWEGTLQRVVRCSQKSNIVCEIQFTTYRFITYIHVNTIDYNSIRIPTNLWLESNHAPSKNIKHMQKQIRFWQGFLYQTTTVQGSTEHLNLFRLHGSTSKKHHNLNTTNPHLPYALCWHWMTSVSRVSL